MTRTAPDTIVLDTDGGWGEALIARLNRFKLRVKADIEPLDWRCLALRGPRRGRSGRARRPRAVDASWPGLPGIDLLGGDPEPARWRGR